MKALVSLNYLLMYLSLCYVEESTLYWLDIIIFIK